MKFSHFLKRNTIFQNLTKHQIRANSGWSNISRRKIVSCVLVCLFFVFSLSGLGAKAKQQTQFALREIHSTVGNLTRPFTLSSPTSWSARITAANAATVQVGTPSVAYPTIRNITSSSATLGGEVTSDGGAPITERGVIFALTATNSDPFLNGTGVTKVTAYGAIFSVDVTGLTPGVGYTFRAYATNSAGTGYTAVAQNFG